MIIKSDILELLENKTPLYNVNTGVVCRITSIAVDYSGLFFDMSDTPERFSLSRLNSHYKKLDKEIIKDICWRDIFKRLSTNRVSASGAEVSTINLPRGCGKTSAISELRGDLISCGVDCRVVGRHTTGRNFHYDYGLHCSEELFRGVRVTNKSLIVLLFDDCSGYDVSNFLDKVRTGTYQGVRFIVLSLFTP